MGNANETYSAIFDLFTYWGYSMEAEPGKTLGEILQEALDTISDDEREEMMLQAVENQPANE